MTIKVHTPLSDATPADVGAGLDNAMTVNPADLLAAITATGPGTPNALQQALMALVAPTTSLPDQDTINATTTAINNPALIPQPMAGQSTWIVTGLGELAHFVPGMTPGWQIVNNRYGTTETNALTGATNGSTITAFTYIVPRAGKVIVTATSYNLVVFPHNEQNTQVGINKNGVLIPGYQKSVGAQVDGFAGGNAASTFPVLAGDVITIQVFRRGELPGLTGNVWQLQYV